MPTLTEGLRRAEFLLGEADDLIAYDSVTYAAVASTAIKPGTVLGKVTATGHYKPYASGNSDGSQTAVAIALDWVLSSVSNDGRGLKHGNSYRYREPCADSSVSNDVHGLTSRPKPPPGTAEP